MVVVEMSVASLEYDALAQSTEAYLFSCKSVNYISLVNFQTKVELFPTIFSLHIGHSSLVAGTPAGTVSPLSKETLELKSWSSPDTNEFETCELTETELADGDSNPALPW